MGASLRWWYVSDILKITWQACPLSLEDGKEVPHLEVIEIILTTFFVTILSALPISLASYLVKTICK